MSDATRQIDRMNLEIDNANKRVVRVLRRVSGLQYGPKREEWVAWYSDRIGYTYEPTRRPPKPLINQTVVSNVVPPPPPAFVFTGVLPPRPRSCFAAGTPVRTRAGLRPIEAVGVGDLVLSRDVSTGRLGFHPVVAVFRNPPGATLRVELEDETIVATPVHRFWRVGRGWAMARELRPGDTIRTLVGGPSRVVSVRGDRVQRVFNLEVARDHTFLVGWKGLLVHDNTLPGWNEPVFDSVDGPVRAPTASGTAVAGALPTP
jgi:hypothetical protein